MTFFTVPDAKVSNEYRGNRQLIITLTDVASSCGSRVDSDNHTAFESESKCGSAVLDFDPAAGIGVVICVEAQKCSGLIPDRYVELWSVL